MSEFPASFQTKYNEEFDRMSHFVKSRKIRTRRIRWWNIIKGVLWVITIACIALPLRYDFLRQGFVGGLFTEAWGIIATAIVGWILFKHFRTEQFQEIAPFYDEPFRSLHEVSLKLSSAGLESTETAVQALGDFRSSIKRSAEDIESKAAFFNRYLDVGELARADACRDAAKRLSQLEWSGEQIEFMYQFFHNALVMWGNSATILRQKYNSRDEVQLIAASYAWHHSKFSKEPLP